MTEVTNQSGNTANEGDVVAGDKNVNHNYGKKTRLATLFERLRQEFDQQKRITQISDDLKRYADARDTVGLEQKLADAGKKHLLENAAWLKQEYFKKLTKFQFFEPAQEIHAFLLGLVLSKFTNIVTPMIQNGSTDHAISKAISIEIVDPVIKIVQEEGCEDIMGLSPIDVDGMIYFLTGQCHIKWTK